MRQLRRINDLEVNVSNELPKDPDSEGWFLGWGVLRNAPWSLHGVYLNKAEAESQAKVAGEGYVARYGSHRPETDDFVWSDLTQN